jgi:hypothetical protein
MPVKSDPKKPGQARRPLKPTDIVSIHVDVATAKSLILALSQAIGGTGNGPKKKPK